MGGEEVGTACGYSLVKVEFGWFLLLSLLQIYYLSTECLLNDGSVGIVGLRKGSWALRWAVGRI